MVAQLIMEFNYTELNAEINHLPLILLENKHKLAIIFKIFYIAFFK